MIVSFLHNFIFVQVPKTAGGSLRIFLKNYDDSTKLETMAGKHHLTACQIRDRLGQDIYKRFYKFSIVRNSWDWLVSLYHYILEQSAHPRHDEVKKLQSFEAFVDFEIALGEMRQVDFLTDESGNLIVDFVGRFETLHQDVDYLCRKLKLEKQAFPHRNKSSHVDYRKYYNDRTQRLVHQYFQKDIDLFGYEF